MCQVRSEKSPFYCGPQMKTMASAPSVGTVISTPSHWAGNQAGRQEVWPTGLLWSLALREVEKQHKSYFNGKNGSQRRKKQNKRGRRQKERNIILCRVTWGREREERGESQPMQCETGL